MKRIKRIAAAVVLFAMILGMFGINTSAAVYSDVTDDKYYADAVEALTIYGIISGYDGKFRPGAQITRAEFSKVTAIVAGLDDEVYSNAGNKKFDDVALDNWATGYINTVANNKLLVGYPNGKFMPSKSITYAEAVTVVLRVLGYSTADLGDNWPYAYMVKAKSLGLTDGLTFTDNKPISRADVCVIINRALDTDMNGSAEKLISKLEITSKEDVFLVATKALYKDLAHNEVMTESGVYKSKVNVAQFNVPSMGTLYFNKDDEIIRFEETEKISKNITTVESIVNDDIYFADGTSCNGLGISSSTLVYNDGILTTFGSFKSNIKKGARVSVAYDEDKNVKILMIGNAEYTEATTVYSDVYSALAKVGVSKDQIDRAEVFRDDYAAKLEDIEMYDVVYYVEEDSKVYAYSDKVSGTYNKAYPNKANVTSVEISGTEFELETTTAINKLGEKSGSYKLGDKITVLLGKDGAIADVIEKSSGNENLGILLSYSTENSTEALETGKQYNYITVLNGEGNNVKYKTNFNHENMIGLVGTISIDDAGYAKFYPLTNVKKISGKIDKNNRTVGNHMLTSDCVILERTYLPSNYTGTATARKIEIEEIEVAELTDEMVIHAVTSGSFEDVSLLIVEKTVKDNYIYGILEKVSGGASVRNTSGSYTVFSNGTSSTYSANFYKSIPASSGVELQVEGGSLKSINKLYTLAVRRPVSAIDANRVKIGESIYSISDNVQLMKKTSSGYIGLSKYDIEELEGKQVTLHADSNTPDSIVRIIVVFD